MDERRRKPRRLFTALLHGPVTLRLLVVLCAVALSFFAGYSHHGDYLGGLVWAVAAYGASVVAYVLLDISYRVNRPEAAVGRMVGAFLDRYAASEIKHKYVEINGVEDASRILAVVPTGKTMPFAQGDWKGEVCKYDSNNKRFVCGEQTGITLNANDGLHLDFYEDHPEPLKAEQEAHIGCAEGYTVEAGEKKIDHVAYTLTGLLKETHEWRKTSSQLMLVALVIVALILITFFYHAYEKQKPGA